MNKHSVEKIGGTSMSNYQAVRNNIIFSQQCLYDRIFVVSAYGGVTNDLIEHKKTGHPGIFSLFSSSVQDDSWLHAFDVFSSKLMQMNADLFDNDLSLQRANKFIHQRLMAAKDCLLHLQKLCFHGHFSVKEHLDTVKEMLSSIGEVHSAWNMTELLKQEGVNACFVDLTGWRSEEHVTLDERINSAFSTINLSKQLPIVTGYAHCKSGLMSTFDRGYSEMTFSRVAVLTNAREAIIHKEFHLSSADPKIVGAVNAVPIGRTNYDVADQLANLGMEAIHPKAAKGLRKNNTPLRIKNTFEPKHEGTLITSDYVSETPCVEIIAGNKNIYAIELFDQNMVGQVEQYDQEVLLIFKRFGLDVIAKDMNANTITHFTSSNLKNVKRLKLVLEETFPEAEIKQRKVCIVSAIGSDMQVPGILAKAVKALADSQICVQAMHQSMRQVDMQFVVNEDDYECAIRSLHCNLVEVHEHGRAICLA